MDRNRYIQKFGGGGVFCVRNVKTSNKCWWYLIIYMCGCLCVSFLRMWKNTSNKYWWHCSFTWMKIYSSKETNFQVATNQCDYRLVVYVHHKIRTPPTPERLTLFIGLCSTSKNFSNFIQTVLLPRGTKTFQWESYRLQYTNFLLRSAICPFIRSELLFKSLL